MSLCMRNGQGEDIRIISKRVKYLHNCYKTNFSQVMPKLEPPNDA